MSAAALGPWRVGLFTSGLWARRADLARLTGLTPVRRFRSARGLAAVCGWGLKPTAARARAAARAAGVPYWSAEDGFLRSLRPGDAEPPLSLVLDRTGIYYDAARPSDLEAMIRARAADPAAAARDAAPALHALRSLGLTKYALFDAPPEALDPLHSDPARNVLIVDQTAGDASLAGAGATPDSFAAMLAHAAEAHPEARLILKTHPETRAGRRAGHFSDAALAEAAGRHPALDEAARAGRLIRLSERVRPKDLLARVGRVHAVCSLLGFEALIHGVPVTCHGAAFYAGWGLTEDRAPTPARRRPVPLEALVAAAFADYCRWFDPESRAPISLAAAADRLDALAKAARAR